MDFFLGVGKEVAHSWATLWTILLATMSSIFIHTRNSEQD